jgi:hypothetical protein
VSLADTSKSNLESVYSTGGRGEGSRDGSRRREFAVGDA